MRPFLRWAGGKRWLTEARGAISRASGSYVEPFLGGGAYFFAAETNRAILSDTNPYLINAYVWMRDEPMMLYRILQRHFDVHCTEHYYETRQTLSPDGLVEAADFIYLNRACFNGLFRVNLNGKFNVPIGSKVYPLREISEFSRWSKHLSNAQVKVSDFEPILDQASEGDFVFLDPPYTVNHNSNGFIEYNEQIFTWSDQVRLHASVLRAMTRGADFLLTNADHKTVRELYADDCELKSVQRGSEMASNTRYRGMTTELLVTPR